MITNIYFDWGDTLAYPHLKKKFIKDNNPYEVLYPDALEVLEYLNKKYKIGIISNSRASKDDFLNSLKVSNLIQYFKGSILFSNEICEKPCQNIFSQALQNDNINPNNAVMIGNSYKNDIIGAQKIGMHTLYLNREGLGDINNLWDLYYHL